MDRRAEPGWCYATEYLIEDGHVWTHGLGEQRRYTIQHTLRYQIWEIDQPHLLHAHGRAAAPATAIRGPGQAAHFGIRDQLATHPRAV